MEFTVKDEVKLTYPTSVARSNGFYEVKVDGVPSNVTHVWFPTWTDANGQDDLEDPWIEGERIGANSWRIAIPFYRHNNEAGTYITHIYAGDAYGNMQGIKGMTVSVQ